MLRLPFQNESKLIQTFLSAQAFLQKNHLLDLADIQFAAYLHDIERAVRLLSAMQEDIGPVVAPNTHDYEESHDQISDDHSFINAENIEISGCCDQYLTNNSSMSLSTRYHPKN